MAMGRKSFRHALATLFAAVLCWPAAAGTWTEYSYPDAGFSVQFPGQPKVENGTYVAADGALIPAWIYSLRRGKGLFIVTVADFSDRPAEHDKVIADAADLVRKTGEVRADLQARVKGQYGQQLSVVGKDGSLSMVAIFFADRRLYQVIGTSFPPNADEGSGDNIRFQQSLDFLGDLGYR